MKYDSTLRLNEAKVVEMHARGETAANDCHQDFPTTTNVVALRFTGGATTNGLFDLANDQTSAFVLRDASGNSLETGSLGIAGLGGDGDNNFDLCLDDSFDIDALESVFVSCSGNDIIVPPKGPDYPCVAHSLKVDKSRASQDYMDACKCDFDHNYNAVCDPEGRLPATSEAFGRNYCEVWDSSSCPDIFYVNGTAMSYQACEYRQSDWTSESTECSGLTEDVRAPSAEVCKSNCDEDDTCYVYQFHDDGRCFRGNSVECSGTSTVVSGGRKNNMCHGDALAYCNTYSDLMVAFCGGERCTEAHRSTCEWHYNAHGKQEIINGRPPLS